MQMQARRVQMEGVARRNRKGRRQYVWKGSGVINIYVNAVVIDLSKSAENCYY